MAQKRDLDKVRSLIEMLSDRTVSRGCNEAEALAAVEMINRLQAEHEALAGEHFATGNRLTTAEVDFSPATVPQEMAFCAISIAKFCDCAVWGVTGEKGEVRHYVFGGYDADVPMAVYLFNVISRAISYGKRLHIIARAETLDPKVHDPLDPVALEAFGLGMVWRLNDRLEAMRMNRDANRQASVEASATHESKLNSVEVFGQRHLANPDPKPDYVDPVRDEAAFGAGWAQGENVGLFMPLAASKAPATRGVLAYA